YGDRLSLWNPATREFRPLPPAPFVTEHFLCNYDHEFGLGFDQLTQDYKVVWIRVFFDNRGQGQGQGQGQGSYLHNSVSVYSSCDNSRKNLQFPSSFTLGLPYSVTYLNGIYYWICRSRNNNICKIQSFAMGSEQFGEMQGPNIPGKHWVRLTSCGDSLAMLVSDKSMTSIYEMKQEGSWSKVFTVQPCIEAAHLPKGIWENDKIVFDLTETSQLVLYDPTTSQVTDLGIQLKLIGCCVFNYKESLALITKGNESQDQDNTDRANEVVQLLGGRMMSRIENQFPPSDLSFSE
uniref:F-box family protein n=2 Tax=Solanum tuberosum TaxID=4113 RepID=M1DF49_SOLTU